MHECNHCGEEHETPDGLREHVKEHDLHWHHCPLCGEDLRTHLEEEDIPPSSHHSHVDRVRRRHIAETDDPVHLGY